jgi:CheY-like chemotaxis protein
MPSILVIDDDKPFRHLARVALEKGGYRVLEAGDGQAGVEVYVRDRPDLVLCDVFMPGIDGLDVLRMLRRQFPGVRVVTMSGGGSLFGMDFLPAARALGAVGTLSKPFGVSDLLETVGRLLTA